MLHFQFGIIFEFYWRLDVFPYFENLQNTNLSHAGLAGTQIRWREEGRERGVVVRTPPIPPRTTHPHSLPSNPAEPPIPGSAVSHNHRTVPILCVAGGRPGLGCSVCWRVRTAVRTPP